MSFIQTVQELVQLQNASPVVSAEFTAEKKGHADSVAAMVRQAAHDAATDGETPESAAEFYALAAGAGGVKAGTVKAYKVAIKGFTLMLQDGKAIDIGGGTTGLKAVTAAEARGYWSERTMTGTEREIAGLVALITLRLQGASLDDLQAIAEMLPAHADEVKVTVKAETAKEKKAREAADALAAEIEKRQNGAVPAQSIAA